MSLKEPEGRSTSGMETTGSRHRSSLRSRRAGWCLICALLALLYTTLTGAANTANPTGLWVGEVVADAVSDLSSGEARGPSPAGPFRFPLLIHTDGGGNVSLLKEVAILWLPEAGRHAAYTDGKKLHNLLARSTRPPEGRRISSAALDFPADRLAVEGAMAPGSTLRVHFLLPASHPSNPFYHRYHPDHNQLDERYRPLTAASEPESYDIGRTLWLTVEEVGETTLSGSYRESIEGIHKRRIDVTGSFHLELVSRVPELNR